MPKHVYRRTAGILIAGGAALVYGFLSQYLNHFSVPGIPLYQPPLGAAGNFVLILAFGLLLGLICAWGEPSVPGVLAAAGVAAAAGLLANSLSPYSGLTWLPASIVVNFFLFFPASGAMVPVFALLRLAVNHQTDHSKRPIYLPVRLWAPLLLIFAAVGTGFLTKLPEPAQVVLVRMDDMVKAALSATGPSAIPAPLSTEDVGDFQASAGSGYTLEFTQSDLRRFGIPRPALPEWEMSAVIARFDSGWSLVCLFPNPHHEPRCKGFGNLP